MERIFLAIDIPDKLKEQINNFNEELKKLEINANFVEKENLHINLKFFGDTEKEQKEKIIEKIKEVSENFNSFQLNAKDIGVFPSMNHIKVVWVGVEDKKENLSNLQKELENEFEKIGIKKENRKFIPHITLCRIKTGKNIEKIIKTIKENKDKEFGTFEVENISLIKSELSPNGPKYTIEKIFELRK